MSKKKVMVFFYGNSENRKGAFNATLERIKFLKKTGLFEIEVYMLQFYSSFLKRIFSHEVNRERPISFIVDDVVINNIWQKSSIFNTSLLSRFRTYSIVYNITKCRLNKIIRGFDIVSVHSAVCGMLVSKICSRLDIPYTITWHGTDIHTTPFTSKHYYFETKYLIENTSANFFVSKHLLLTSNSITHIGKKYVLYNGVNKSVFFPYSESEKRVVRDKLQFNDNLYHIGVVGGLIDVKNSLLLPDILKLIMKDIPNVKLHIIGDGYLRSKLEARCGELPVEFHGNVPSKEMPDYYNSLDLVLMPSKNEGLPLTAVEALACGTLFIGSRVGGIPEVVGLDNTAVIDDNFIYTISRLCVDKLRNKQKTVLPKEFDWEMTSEEESKIYLDILERKHFV